MIAIVRIRGNAKVNVNVERTLELLGLKTVNNCVVVPKDVTHIGMIAKTRELITYGEITRDVYVQMLLKWGKTMGGEKVTEEYLKKKGFDLDKFTKEIFEGETTLRKQGIKSTFRLHPPRKGYEGIKLQYNKGGALGDRGAEINELLKRMI